MTLPTNPDDLPLQALREPESLRARAFLNPPFAPETINTRAWRAAEIPAVNGHTNARAVARISVALVDAVYASL